ncbi:MAG: hypothetical protein U0V48_09660 [Anaerolineales bacterium]
MIRGNPKLLFVIAVFLMVFGVVMPFLMVIHLVESTFFLNFLSYGASMLGLLLGIVSVAMQNVGHNTKDNKDDFYKH